MQSIYVVHIRKRPASKLIKVLKVLMEVELRSIKSVTHIGNKLFLEFQCFIIDLFIVTCNIYHAALPLTQTVRLCCKNAL